MCFYRLCIYRYEHRSKKKAKNDFKLKNNTLFGKTMKNVRKHRDNKLTTTESRRSYLQFEPNYRNTKFFIENILATEMRKSGIRMNKPVNLGFSILELREVLMYDFLYDYVAPKFGEKAKLMLSGY